MKVINNPEHLEAAEIDRALMHAATTHHAKPVLQEFFVSPDGSLTMITTMASEERFFKVRMNLPPMASTK